MTVKKIEQPLESFYTLYKLSLQFENRSPKTIDTNARRLAQFATWARQAQERTPILADFFVETIQQYAAYLRVFVERKGVLPHFDIGGECPFQLGHGLVEACKGRDLSGGLRLAG
jgi:predicted ATP-dependent protease